MVVVIDRVHVAPVILAPQHTIILKYSTTSSLYKYYRQVLSTLSFPTTVNNNMHSSAQFNPTSNMVAIRIGHSQLTGASKDEYPLWQRSLRALLNSLKCLDSESGDKIRAVMGREILPEIFGESRGKVTSELLDSEQGPFLKPVVDSSGEA